MKHYNVKFYDKYGDVELCSVLVDAENDHGILLRGKLLAKHSKDFVYNAKKHKSSFVEVFMKTYTVQFKDSKFEIGKVVAEVNVEVPIDAVKHHIEVVAIKKVLDNFGFVYQKNLNGSFYDVVVVGYEDPKEVEKKKTEKVYTAEDLETLLIDMYCETAGSFNDYGRYAEHYVTEAKAYVSTYMGTVVKDYMANKK